MFSTMAAAPEDIRVDPEDGLPRSYAEVQAFYKGRYSEQEIREYWEFEMIHHEGEAIHNVANDPFLTHASRVPQGAATATRNPVQTMPQIPAAISAPGSAAATQYPLPPPAEDLADVGCDPFLSNDRYKSTVDVKKDPFISHTGGPGNLPFDVEGRDGRRQQFAQAMAAAKRHWTEQFFRLLGPGDPNRDVPARNMIILGPWLVFMWVLLVWLLLQHFSDLAAVVLTAFVLLGCSGLMLSWHQGRRGGPVSFLTLGGLCLLATAAATMAGQYGWERYWRQYWWTQTGSRGGATSAGTPAMARADYAVLDFWDSKAGSTYNDTRVDYSRGAGYKDTEYYCVAPILSPELSSASLVRVNFWAIGINCCQRAGAFTCDDSREWDAGRAVVMLEDGYPCPSCNIEKFRAAVTKAEAVHGLVSANGARFVRWVKDPDALETTAFLGGFGFVLVCAVLAGGACGAVGWLAWYYGLGIQMSDEEALIVATEAALQHGPNILSGNYVLDPTSLSDASRRKQAD